MEVKLMLSRKNLTIVGFVVVVFVILQAILISIGKVDSPVTAAVDFARAYFMLDGASMSERLCSEMVEDEELNIINTYLNSVAERARELGFSKNYMRNQLSHISTELQMTDENNAEVRITGERLRSINPVFALIGRLFFLIEKHEVDETLSLIKEDGRWKVCGNPFSLSEI
jgi:5-bromo-4-chloroindolyl phosphate hydrolysis protein